jgi:hypothetical protein
MSEVEEVVEATGDANAKLALLEEERGEMFCIDAGDDGASNATVGGADAEGTEFVEV